MFSNYSDRELGYHLVQFQEALDKCSPDQPSTKAFCEQMIRNIATELLIRYRQETELLYTEQTI